MNESNERLIKTIDRLTRLIEKRKPKGYCEMLVNQADVMYLDSDERQQLHDARMAMQTDSAEDARLRNIARRALRKSQLVN